MATVLVFLDSPGEELHNAERELLALAGSLGEPTVALTHQPSTGFLEILGGFAVATVYIPAAEDTIRDVLVAGKAAVLAAAATASRADVVLLGNSYEAKEVAARAGIRLNSGVITDAVGVDSDLTVTKSVLAGAYTVRARVQTGSAIITVKPNSFHALEPGLPGDPAQPRTVDLPAIGAVQAAQITGRTAKPVSGRPELTEARVVVAGGRGVDGNFAPLEEFADLLGGAVGASRAATDAGWIEHSAQIGQTGKTVSPQLYVSAGISGAIQQKAGMQTSQVIVAINKDADSPVFEIADFGIVGDLFTVLPQASAELRKRRG